MYPWGRSERAELASVDEGLEDVLLDIQIGVVDGGLGPQGEMVAGGRTWQIHDRSGYE